MCDSKWYDRSAVPCCARNGQHVNVFIRTLLPKIILPKGLTRQRTFCIQPSLMASLLHQPVEVLALIFRNASVAYLLIDVARVCRRFRDVLRTDLFWNHWRLLNDNAVRQHQLQGELFLYVKARSAAMVHCCLVAIDDESTMWPTLVDALYDDWSESEDEARRRCDVLRIFLALPTFDMTLLDYYALIDACYDADSDECALVRRLLENDAFPRRRLYNGVWRLTISRIIQTSNITLFRLLLDEGIGASSAIEVCAAGEVEFLQLLSDYGVQFNLSHLYEAVRVHNIDSVRHLLAHKAWRNRNPCMYGLSPLKLAAQSGWMDMARLLLQAEGCCDTYDRRLAFDAACKQGHVSMVRLLIEYGCDPAKNDNAALIAAAQRVDGTAMVLCLLEYASLGVDPSARQQRALCSACELGYSDTVRALLADPRTDPSVSQSTPLYNAVTNGHVATTRLLLRDERIDLDVVRTNLDTYQDMERVSFNARRCHRLLVAACNVAQLRRTWYQ